jgi:hypothetical protein
MIKEVKGLNGQVEVYEERIVIKRTGIFGWSSHFRAGDKTIPLKSITSIQFKPATFFSRGFIQFGILGGIENTGDVKSAVKDENSVVFSQKQTADFFELKNFIENNIYKNDNTVKTASQEINDLEKLAELFKKGVITEEEFNIKKKQLLNL